MNKSDIAHKRSVLFSARIRFSPETQPVRETAIDRIIEQNLCIAHSKEGLTLQQIENQGAVSFADGIPAISRLDMQNSLKRLADINRVIVTGKPPQERYRLSEQALQELSEMQRLTETRFSRVVGRLFRNTEEASLYATPFLECLCIIFSRLGDTYVRLLKGEASHRDLVSLPDVLTALQEIKARYPSINEADFKGAVFSFFRDSDPDYDTVKWNMAQNYYVAKALGLDPSGYLLSKEVFGSAVFYLDTNIIVHALEPRAPHYKSFEALSRACRQLQINLNVCYISLDELRSAVDFQREIILKVADQIPEATAPKIRGIFFQLYREELKSAGKVNFDELFADYYHPMEMLTQSYHVQLVDDGWFKEAENQKETQTLFQGIRQEYQARRGRPKSGHAVLHDALLLRWILLERERGAKNTWLVTLDTSLPGFLPQATAGSVRPLAITLDALLQWISPIVIADDDVVEEEAAIFSEAVKYQLLPQESFFDLRDFLMFAEMELSCKELPAEDVEECIRYIKTHAPNVDPSSAVNREKIAREISKFLADPGRKYKQEVQRLESEVVESRRQYQGKLGEIESWVRERDERIAKLEKERIEQEVKVRRDALRRSALIRAGVVGMLVLGYEVGAIYLAWQYGEGTTLFQKIISSWPLLGLGCVIGVGLFWFILGRERIGVLGWPFTKVLKDG